ncbi:heparinase II/III family protein [Labrenzia sp. PHM005]|uniref:heparinase II/III domain-containing protein n=1 Tax=Labrenzia sp. PHM005 TaxID=2590016 RepID=UPI00114091D0|nr:heparinase II/III family protein [Labrenzia sp. PHM005]QDG76713.1 hypothetical protein FJ695_12990 [Labrenzia sp. PHM005]
MEEATQIAKTHFVPSQQTSLQLQDRNLLSVSRYTATAQENADRLFAADLICNGVVTDVGDHVSAAFTGETDSYQLKLALPEAQLSNGTGARIRLRGWESINYICIGYSWEHTFQHVKAFNPAMDHWFDLLVGHEDLAWGWSHNWVHPEDRDISDIRIYIKGKPGASAYLDITEMALWRESQAASQDWLTNSQPVPERVLDAIQTYERKCFQSYSTQAQEFMNTGKCPLLGNVMLNWPTSTSVPPALCEIGTYQFSWHALHPAVILMLYAHDFGELGALFAARDFATGWIERSYVQPDDNLKYAWYDHGTAERCLAMVQLHAAGQQHGFDHRFMAQISCVIFRHAQLLASEAFYASHQSTRYHNHAWFQDLVLLAVSLAFPDWPCAPSWGKIANTRLEDQFAKLIKREKGRAVFVENSIGYHNGVQRIIEFAGNLALNDRRDSIFPSIAEELRGFGEFFRYPDTRCFVSQGDTYRRPNLNVSNPRGQTPYGRTDVTILPATGYAIVKANHENRPFMLTMLATSISSTHKHEDNLSVTLYFDGVEWLIDPSFFSHEYKDTIPAYLRSAAAHNNIFIPNQPYSISPGLARLDGTEIEDACRISGSHDGYEGLRITRQLTCSTKQLEITCTDMLSMPCAEAQLRFQCGEYVSAHIEENRVFLTHPGSDFTLELEIGAAAIGRVRGDMQPSSRIGGIVGHGFMEHNTIETLIADFDSKSEINWCLRVV